MFFGLDAVNNLIKIVILFSLIFILFPSFVIKFEEESNNLLDKTFISLTKSTFVIIILVHLLVITKLYETIITLAVLIGIYIFARWNKQRKMVVTDQIGFFARNMVKLFDLSESEGGLRQQLFYKAYDTKEYFKNLVIRIFNYIRHNPLIFSLNSFIFVILIYTRFYHSLTHLYYATSDPYVHIMMAKYLTNKEIYVDGIYPYGYHCVMSILNILFSIDLYYIVRFFGPMASILIVLSIYYSAKKSFNNSRYVAWMAAFLYVIVEFTPFNSWRQISSLSQEYALIFLMPGLYFFSMFYKTDKRYYLILTAQALAVTLFIHVYVSVFLVLGCIIIALINFKKTFMPKNFLKLLLIMVTGGLVGLIPIGYAFLIGKVINGTSYITDYINPPNFATIFSKIISYKEGNHAFFWFMAVILSLLIITIIIKIVDRKGNNREATNNSLAILLLSVLSYLLYRAQDLSFLQIMDPARVGVSLTVFFSISASICVVILEYIVGNKFWGETIKRVVSIAVLVVIIGIFGIRVPIANQYEYDDAVKGYLSIKKEYPPRDWTIIAPNEQYNQAYNYGYHYQLFQFVKTMGEKDHEPMAFPTNYLFIFVEKIPVKTNAHVTIDDALKPFPVVNGQAIQYYYNSEYRRIIEAKAYFWAEEYMKNNSNMKVYFEDEKMKMYIITQDAKKPIKF